MEFLCSCLGLLLAGASLAQALTIATYNVENLDPKVEEIAKVDRQSKRNVDDDTPRFALLGQQIAGILNSPDIVALQEIQDNDGAEISQVVRADLTGRTLSQAVRSAGGASYIYADIPPQNGTSGGQPGGNIRVGFLYNPDRVRLKRLFTIDDPAFIDSRLPLVGEFENRSGTSFTVVNVHFVSKRGGEPANQTRIAQAEAVHNYVRSLTNVIVLGDINDTPQSPAAKVLARTLVNTSIGIAPPDRFTYSFRGMREMIDQIFLSPALASQATTKTFNLNITENDKNPDRASDHNPVLTILNLP